MASENDLTLDGIRARHARTQGYGASIPTQAELDRAALLEEIDRLIHGIKAHEQETGKHEGGTAIDRDLWALVREDM